MKTIKTEVYTDKNYNTVNIVRIDTLEHEFGTRYRINVNGDGAKIVYSREELNQYLIDNFYLGVSCAY